MSDAPDIRLNLLLFSAGGVSFAMDAETAVEIADYGGEAADDLFWFHEVLGYGAGAPVYTMPTVITIRTEDSRSYRVIVDKMEDVTEVGAVDIRPFPPLLEPVALRKGMWGITVRDGRIILLVDISRLVWQRPDTA